MKRSIPPCMSSRRNFLANALPAGTLLCLGCGGSSALAHSGQNSQAPAGKHKFSEDSKMTFEEVFQFAYRDRFIPMMKSLAREVGENKFLEMLKKASSTAAVEETKKEAEPTAQRNPSTFIAPLKEPSYLWKHVLTYEIVEDTEKAAEIKVTECLWAKTFREMDAADIGYAVLCHPDYATAPVFNPKMKMIRTKTLMQGDDCCNHRWVLEG